MTVDHHLPILQHELTILNHQNKHYQQLIDHHFPKFEHEFIINYLADSPILVSMIHCCAIAQLAPELQSTARADRALGRPRAIAMAEPCRAVDHSARRFP